MIVNPDLYLLFLECHRRYQYVDGQLIYKVSPASLVKIGDRADTPANGYLKAKIHRKPYFMHRLIFFMHYGSLPCVLDHIDCDPKNNRIENLRAVTPEQNARNRKNSKNNTTGIKGISRHSRGEKLVAQCWANGKQNYLGVFANISDAERAVKSFREQHHGEFAKHA